MCLTKDYYCYYYSSVHNNLDNMSFKPLLASTSELWIGLVEVQVEKPQANYLLA